MLKASKRFYRCAEVLPANEGYYVLLDGRALKTPAGMDLVLPTKRLAQDVAEEWLSQTEEIRPQTMPLTRLAATAVDRVAPLRTAVIDRLMAYAASDLLCYRAEGPSDLSSLQQRVWQPLLDWATTRWAIRLRVTTGVMPVEQPPAALAALRSAVERLDDMELTALASIVQTSGSLVLGLAVAAGRIDAEAAFDAAQLDESYQSHRWGRVEEIRQRQARLKEDLAVAAHFIAHAGGGAALRRG